MAIIDGDNTDETLTGTTDDDTISGGAGNDSVSGGDGDDILYGDDGDEALPDGSLVFEDTFDSGSGAWTNGTVDDTQPLLGSILGPITGTSTSGDVETATSLTFDSAYDDAVIEFTFHRLDTWDGEDLEIFSDGQMIFSKDFFPSTATGETQTTTIGSTTYTVTFESDGDASQLGYWSNGQTWTYDQSFSVRIEVENVSADFDLGFGSTLDQDDYYASEGAFDESYGFDNFSVVSTNDTSIDITGFTDADDTIDGGAGNDTIYGEEGDDTLNGGSGNDTIYGGDGADTVDGGDDEDTIYGASGDVVDGGEGGVDNDTLIITDPGATVTYDPSNPENGTITFSDSTTMTFTNIENVVMPCFVAGTHIQTQCGTRLIEDLKVGDFVRTLDNGCQPIRWIGSRSLDIIDLAVMPRLKPIRIKAGALAPMIPDRDLLVSPQHRVLIRSRVAERMFGEAEVLIPAKKLLDLTGISVAMDLPDVTYYHFLFERHEVVFSNDAPTESLFTGKEALKAVGKDARHEIETLFPMILADDYEPIPARRIHHKGRQIASMIKRLQKNNKYALEALFE